jgi:enoyl-CoA hydratase/carnithine racemase
MSMQRERIDDGIEVLRLDRPEVRNAMDTALLAALLGALAELAADETLRVLVIGTTSERALCAGADVGEPLTPEQGVARMEAFARFYAAVEAFPTPTIAVCVGNCVGAGAELVAGCDLRVAGDNLKLAWAGARLGVPVGPARLAPLVGLSIAKDLVFSGRVVGAEEAAQLHLAHRVAPAAAAETVAIELARELAANDGPGLRRLKRMFGEYDETAARTERENAELVDFQRHGGGLPQG